MKSIIHHLKKVVGCTLTSLLIMFACRSQQTIFIFPGGGVKNNNGTIGDFCCTGETATVLNNLGSVVGYVYYYGFKGGRNIGNNESVASEFNLSVSAVVNYYNNKNERIRDRINFTSAELFTGSTKTLKLGELRFVAIIKKVRKYINPAYYIMGSVMTEVTVTSPIILTTISGSDNRPPDANPVPDNTMPTEQTKPIKRILENGDVELSFPDGSRKIIFESGKGFKVISANGQESVVSYMTVPAYIPPTLPGDEIDKWLEQVNKSLLTLIQDELKNDQTSINNLMAGENNLNIYQIINRRFRFIQSLNIKR